MQRAEDPTIAAKLKVLIRYLVESFPNTSILFREIERRYHLFVVVPYSGGPEKVIQVDQAVLREQEVTVEEFALRIDRLNLPTILQRCARYDLEVWTAEGSSGTSRQSRSQNAHSPVLLPNACSEVHGQSSCGPYAPAACVSVGHSYPG